MTNSEWGAKRTCPGCGMRFYDLNKNPAQCPKCQHSFDPNQLVRARRGRSVKKAVDTEAKKAEAKKKPDPRKKKSIDGIDLDEYDDIEPIAGMGDIEEIEEIDEADDLEEIDEIDDLDENANDDDADDESIIEDLNAEEESLVDSVEDAEEVEEEDDKPRKAAPRKKKK